eukprot:scaffold135848_cov81-Phaeocystis_antarctica.AAC.1
MPWGDGSPAGGGGGGACAATRCWAGGCATGGAAAGCRVCLSGLPSTSSARLSNGRNRTLEVDVIPGRRVCRSCPK